MKKASEIAAVIRPKLSEAATLLRNIPNTEGYQRRRELDVIGRILRDVANELEQPLSVETTAPGFYASLQAVIEQVESTKEHVELAMRLTSMDQLGNSAARFLEDCIGFIDNVQPEKESTVDWHRMAKADSREVFGKPWNTMRKRKGFRFNDIDGTRDVLIHPDTWRKNKVGG